MQRTIYRRSFKETLRQCQEIIESFEGSEETLGYIRRIEDSLKRLLATVNQGMA